MLIFSIDYDADLYSQEKENSFLASKKGMLLCAELLEKYAANATIFIQAKAPKIKLAKKLEICCHGLSHEDFTKLSEKETRRRIEDAISLIAEKFNTKPKGFRAPYLKINAPLLRILGDYFVYDSSSYAELVSPIKKGKIIELPITQSKKEKFKAYLISFFRGKRKLNFLKNLEKEREVLHVAMHSWDLFWDNGFLKESQTLKRIAVLKKILSEFDVCSIQTFLKEFSQT